MCPARPARTYHRDPAALRNRLGALVVQIGRERFRPARSGGSMLSPRRSPAPGARVNIERAAWRCVEEGCQRDARTMAKGSP